MDTKKLRQKLLDLAVRGKLVPQDPNDEPASGLLKRIHEEKLAMVERGELKKKDVQNDTVIYFGSDGLPYEKQADGKGEAQCIAGEVPFALPDGWSWARLKTVSRVVTDGDHQPPPQTAEGIPFLVISNIAKGVICFDDTRFVPGDYYAEIDSQRIPQRGDLLISVTGSYGIPAVVDTDRDFCFQRHMALIKPLLSARFLSRVVASTYCSKWFDKKATGTAQKTVALGVLRSTLIPVPPLAEQRRIVAALDKYLALVDEIERDRAELDGLFAKLKSKVLDLAVRGELTERDPADEPADELLRRIHREKLAMVECGELKPKDAKGDTVIFTGSDGLRYEKPADGRGEAKCIEGEIPFEIPEGWGWARLGALIRLISGVDMEKAEYNADRDGIPYITGASNFDNGYLVENRWTKTPKRISEKGELLFTCKGTVGEMAVNRFDAAHIARQVMSIKPYRGLSLSYLQLALSWYVSSIRAQAKGFIPGIERTTLLGVLLPVPPLAEQQRINNKIEEAFNLLR